MKKKTFVNIFKFCEDNRRGKSFPYAPIVYLSKRGMNCINLLRGANKKTQEKNILNIPTNLFNIYFNLWKIKGDVLRIVSMGFNPITPLLFLLAKMKGMKVIIQPDYSEYYKPKKFSLKYMLFKLNLSLADKIVCATEYEREIIVPYWNINSKKFIVIPLGSKYSIRTLKKENYIFSVAGWSDRKNLEKMIRVFFNVLKKKKTKLILAGDFSKRWYNREKKVFENGEEYKKRVEKQIKDLKIEKYIKFIGPQYGERLRELFQKAKLFYLPSKEESFGRVYVESYSCGTPVIAEKNSAVKYVVNEGLGGLKNTEEDQKERILELLSNEKKYKKIHRNCLSEARKYSWQNISKEWEKLINSI